MTVIAFGLVPGRQRPSRLRTKRTAGVAVSTAALKRQARLVAILALLCCQSASAQQSHLHPDKQVAPAHHQDTSVFPRPIKQPFYTTDAFLVGVGLVLIFIVAASAMRARRPDHEASGRLAAASEQLEQYSHPWACGGFMLGSLIHQPPIAVRLWGLLFRKNLSTVLRLKPQDRLNHVLIQAGPGSGKTTAYFIPPIIEDAFSGTFNLFILDRKAPEIFQMVSKPWADCGHRVIYFDPWQPEHTFAFEPLFGASEAEIEAMVECFVTVSPDPESSLRHYRELERMALRVVFRAAQEWARCTGPDQGLKCGCRLSRDQHELRRQKDPVWRCPCRCRRHFCTLPAVAELIQKGSKATKAAIHAADPTLNYNLTDLWGMQAARLAELFAGLAGRLQLFREPLPARAFSRRDFAIHELVPAVEKGNAGPRTILIVGAPQSQGDVSNVLAALFTQLVAKSVYLRRDHMAATQAQWSDVVPLIAMLDEFGTYHVPGIANFVATCRSGGAGVVAALQNQNQLADWYGPHAVRHMSSNFRTQIYLRGTDCRIAQELSERTGKKIVHDKIDQASRSSQAWQFWPHVSRGNQTRPIEVPALRPEEIEFMDPSQAVVLGQTVPGRVKLVRYFDDSRFSAWVSASQQTAALRLLQNRECDRVGTRRGEGEPRRLPQYIFDWTVIPGVEAAITAADDPADDAMNITQQAKIRAKARDLGIAGDLPDIAKDVCHVEFSKFTRAQASKLIRHLEKLELQARKGVDGNAQGTRPQHL